MSDVATLETSLLGALETARWDLFMGQEFGDWACVGRALAGLREAREVAERMQDDRRWDDYVDGLDEDGWAAFLEDLGGG